MVKVCNDDGYRGCAGMVSEDRLCLIKRAGDGFDEDGYRCWVGVVCCEDRGVL